MNLSPALVRFSSLPFGTFATYFQCIGAIQRRHDFLIQHLAGDEIDAFACEVSMLSLILADYPNRNGWRIAESDLFMGSTLRTRLSEHNIILCNPPFQDFTDEERSLYPIADKAYSKPVQVLNAVLEAQPLAFAFLLPRAFVLDRKFLMQRKKMEMFYGDIEVVALPEGVFHASSAESALVIAQTPRSKGVTGTKLCSVEVSDRDRMAFLKSGRTTTQRRISRSVSESPSGELWIPPLRAIWDYLKASPRLGDHFTIHQGLRWASAQGRALSVKHHPGYRRGLHSARKTQQFVLQQPVWLDCRAGRLLGRRIERPWELPKLVVNAVRLSRGPWRIGVAPDKDGLLCSQQFFGLWPRETTADAQLLIFTAILNGPVANAFLAVHAPAKGLRISTVERIPVPSVLPPPYTGDLVAEYIQHIGESGLCGSSGEQAETLLTRIDGGGAWCL